MPPVKKAKPQKPRKKENVQKKSPPAKENVEEKTAISGQLQKRIAKQKEREDRKRGVVFIKHLPHGFFEAQLKGYFEQFGKVTRLRLARSKRTGGSKGYAFVEFEYPEVAEVAAETMNNYLMFQKLVKAEYIPPEKQKFNYFKTSVTKVINKAGKEIYVSAKTRQINRKVKEHNDWNENNYQKRAARALKRLENLKKKYSHLGIDFSNILVAPQLIKTEGNDNEECESDETATSPKLPPTGSKRKSPKGQKDTQTKNTKTNAKKKKLEPADLLGNTLVEDSEDEDYVPLAANEDNDGSSSDEESYIEKKEKIGKKTVKKGKKALEPIDLLGTTINEDSDDEDFVPNINNKKDGDSDNFEEESPKKAPKTRINQLNRKNTGVKGGKIQKNTKKPIVAGAKQSAKSSKAAEMKKALKLAAAKEAAKPLKTLKEKKIVKTTVSNAVPNKKKAKK